MKVVIMAGGKGTRIASVRNNIPKPMMPVGGKPVLEHEISCLADQGYTDITLVIGHMGDIIREYFGNGRKFGVSISYFEEKEPLGTGGALFQMPDILQDDFFLLNGDIMLDIDFKRMEKYHREKGGWVTLFTHPNDHPGDSALISADSGKRITGWINKEDERTIYKNRVNAGIHVISPKLLKERNLSGRVDLDREMLKPLVAAGKMYVYDSPEYVRDMGTPERYHRVCEDYKSGKIKSRNLRLRQKAVFIDRDGTINQYRGFIKRTEDMVLLEGAAKAMSLAMEEGGILPSQVDYINAHGTGTHHNDLFETRAIKLAFGDAAKDVVINSTKSMIGHLLGAAGGVEFITCVKTIEDGFIHQTVGTRRTDEECDLNYAIGAPIEKDVTYALTNSLGFGGHNATLLLKKYDG